ncbi:MAG: 50S ribosomal protein L30e [Candidatus Bathyarchaeia archaeon]
MSNVDRELRMAINTGRVHLGSKVAITEMRRGRAKMAILSSNCPEAMREKIEVHGRLSGIPVLRHQKDSLDLGTLCGKPFPVSAIVINDQGDSKILEMMR